MKFSLIKLRLFRLITELICNNNGGNMDFFLDVY